MDSVKVLDKYIDDKAALYCGDTTEIITQFGDDSVDITTADLSSYAEDYLRACGMQEEQMEAFREKVFR